MLNIYDVNVDSSVIQNCNKLLEKGFTEKVIEHDERSLEKLKSVSGYFKDIRTFSLENKNIIIAGNKETSLFAYYVEDLTETAYLKWTNQLLKIYHDANYKNTPIKRDEDLVDFFGAMNHNDDMNFVMIEKMKDQPEKFTLLCIIIAPRKLGFSRNLTGNYTKKKYLTRNDELSIGDVFGVAGTLIGLSGFF